jgi:hypothetical protein
MTAMDGQSLQYVTEKAADYKIMINVMKLFNWTKTAPIKLDCSRISPRFEAMGISSEHTTILPFTQRWEAQWITPGILKWTLAIITLAEINVSIPH